MRESVPLPQINISKMPVGGGIAGGIVAISSTVICLVGIPALRYFLPAAFVLGSALALLTKHVKHETPGQAWISTLTKK